MMAIRCDERSCLGGPCDKKAPAARHNRTLGLGYNVVYSAPLHDAISSLTSKSLKATQPQATSGALVLP